MPQLLYPINQAIILLRRNSIIHNSEKTKTPQISPLSLYSHRYIQPLMVHVGGDSSFHQAYIYRGNVGGLNLTPRRCDYYD